MLMKNCQGAFFSVEFNGVLDVVESSRNLSLRRVPYQIVSEGDKLGDDKNRILTLQATYVLQIWVLLRLLNAK